MNTGALSLHVFRSRRVVIAMPLLAHGAACPSGKDTLSAPECRRTQLNKACKVSAYPKGEIKYEHCAERDAGDKAQKPELLGAY